MITYLLVISPNLPHLRLLRQRIMCVHMRPHLVSLCPHLALVRLLSGADGGDAASMLLRRIREQSAGGSGFGVDLATFVELMRAKAVAEYTSPEKEPSIGMSMSKI